MSVVGAFIVPHPPIILPEVGKGEEKKIQNTIAAYRTAMKQAAESNPDTVVITSPHATAYADYFHISPGSHAHGDLHQFHVNGVIEEVDYDSEFVDKLTTEAGKANLAAGTFGEREKELDHGTLIPLRFLHEFTSAFRLVRIGLSGLSYLEHYRLGQCIARTAEALGRRLVFVASGDLSHKLTKDGPYGFAPQGPEFDKDITEAMAKGDFLRFLTMSSDLSDGAAECGLRSFILMAGALDGKAVHPELLSYEGPFGVGYGVASFTIGRDDDSRRFGDVFEKQEQNRLEAVKAKEDDYVRLARYSLETFLITEKPAQLPDKLPEEMMRNEAGVFVSLKKHGQLRGCIGTIAPAFSNVAEEIRHNAVSAGTEDPRFQPVTAKELPDLVYSVDVLGKTESISSPSELDVKRYGVIVTNGHRRGLLLPHLEGVDSVEDQIAIAKQKAGIGKNESCSLERFEVVRHQ